MNDLEFDPDKHNILQDEKEIIEIEGGTIWDALGYYVYKTKQKYCGIHGINWRTTLFRKEICPICEQSQEKM